MDGAPESIEVVNELAQSTDGFASISTGTQTAPVERDTEEKDAGEKGEKCKCEICGGSHVTPFLAEMVRSIGLVPSDTESKPKAASEPAAESKQQPQQQQQAEPRSNPRIREMSLGQFLESIGAFRPGPGSDQRADSGHRANVKLQTNAKPRDDVKLQANAKPQGESKSGESARLFGDIRAEMARGSMSARFKSVSVAKSGDQTFEILNAFAAVIRYTEGEEGKRALSVPDLNDIRLLFDHAKRIVKTRDSDELLETLRSANHTGVAKRASKSIQRIFKYAMAAIRLLAGQASIEFLRAK